MIIYVNRVIQLRESDELITRWKSLASVKAWATRNTSVCTVKDDVLVVSCSDGSVLRFVERLVKA